MADFRDTLTFHKPVTATSTVDLSGATVTMPPATVIGDGTGSPTLTMEKTEAGTDQIRFVSNGKVRGKVTLGATEAMSMSAFDANEAVLGSVSIDGTTGAITLSKGTTITTGGLTVSAGTVDLSAATIIMPASTQTSRVLLGAAGMGWAAGADSRYRYLTGTLTASVLYFDITGFAIGRVIESVELGVIVAGNPLVSLAVELFKGTLGADGVITHTVVVAAGSFTIEAPDDATTVLAVGTQASQHNAPAHTPPTAESVYMFKVTAALADIADVLTLRHVRFNFAS